MKKLLILILLVIMTRGAVFAGIEGENLIDNSRGQRAQTIEKYRADLSNFIVVQNRDGSKEKREIKDVLLAQVAKEDKTINVLEKSSIMAMTVNKKTDMQLAIEAVEAEDKVEFAEPLQLYWISGEPNDVRADNKWVYDSIHMTENWDTVIDYSGLIVAVIDTGVDIDHNDLNVMTGYNTIDASVSANDDHGHGTHVAGSIGAIKDNARSIAGIASNVRILPVKALNSEGVGNSVDIAEAIDWAVANHANIINMSLGSEGFSRVIQTAISNAEDKGVLVVAATGNDSNHWINTSPNDEDLDADKIADKNKNRYYVPLGFPAAYDSVLSVGAVQNHSTNGIVISDYSNIAGNRIFNTDTPSPITKAVPVDVVAPGSGIWSTYTDITKISKSSGTSMATPQVSGLSVLVKGKHTSLTVSELREVIKKSAVSTGIAVQTGTYGALTFTGEDFYGNGLINVTNALKFNKLKTLSMENNPVSGGFTFDPDVTIYNLDVDTSSIKFQTSGFITGGEVILNGGSELDDLSYGNTNLDLNIGLNTVTILYKSGIGDYNTTYTLNITRHERVNLADLTVDGVTVTAFDGDTSDYVLPTRESNQSSITIKGTKVVAENKVEVYLNSIRHYPEMSSPLEDVSGLDLVLDLEMGSNNEIEIRVVDPSDFYKIYRLNVTIDDGLDLTKAPIQFKNKDGINKTPVTAYNFNGETLNYDITIDYDTTKAVFELGREYDLDIDHRSVVSYKLNSDAFVVYPTDDVAFSLDMLPGENTVVIKSEIGTFGSSGYSSQEYTYKITRHTGTEMKAISLKAGDLELVALPLESISPLTIDFANGNVIFNMTPSHMDVTIYLTYDGHDNEPYVHGTDKKIDLTTGLNAIKVKVVGPLPDNNEKIYTFNITRKTGKLLQAITIEDSDNNNVNLTPAFDTETYTYSGILPFSTTNYRVSVTKDEPGSIVIIDDGTKETEALTETMTEIPVDGIKVYVIPFGTDPADYGATRQTYQVNLSRIPADSNNELSFLTTNYGLTPTYSPGTTIYSLNLPHTANALTITATSASNKAKLNIDNHVIDNYIGIQAVALSYGNNEKRIVVTAEDGSTKSYTINVYRNAAPAPPPTPTPPPAPSGGGGGGSPSVFIPPANPGTETPAEPKVDKVEVSKGEDGKPQLRVEVSKDRMEDELKDTKVKSVIIEAKEPEGGDAVGEVKVNLDKGVVNAMSKSDKAVVINFENASFTINKTILEGLQIKEDFQITAKAATVNHVEKNSHSLSEVIELDIFDGHEKINNFKTAIPIRLQYDVRLIKDKDKVSVFYFNEKEQVWVYEGGKLLDDGVIEFKATHFSKYAVREFDRTFDDIDQHWAQKEIEIMAAKKITEGVTETTFEPDRQITSAEFITLINRVLKIPYSSEEHGYWDVEDDRWYTQEVKNAKASGLLVKVADKVLAPDKPIRREEMADIMLRAYLYSTGLEEGNLYITQEVKFGDEGTIGLKFRKSVRLAAALGLFEGNDAGLFNPQDGATRAEASTVIIRLLNK